MRSMCGARIPSVWAHSKAPRDTPEQGNYRSFSVRLGLISSGTYGGPSPGVNRSGSVPPYRCAECSMCAHTSTKIFVLIGNGHSCYPTHEFQVPLQSPTHAHSLIDQTGPHLIRLPPADRPLRATFRWPR